MSESWVQVNLWFRELDPTGFQRFLLDFVSPTIKEVESGGIIKTFHFFFEGNPTFLLRIEPNSPNELEKVRHVAQKYLSTIRNLLVAHPEEEMFTNYPGEAADYGEDGWMIAKKIFEMGSRTSIANVDSTFRKGRKFEEGKMLHCFLNSVGYSTFGLSIHNKLVTKEAMFHLDEFVGRMLILRGERSLDSECEQQIQELVQDEINQWKGKTVEVM